MNLQQRIEWLEKTGKYMLSDDAGWLATKELAGIRNSWFTPEFVELAVTNIAKHFLNRPALESLAKKYGIAESGSSNKRVGIVMAGNIPLVGFHDFLCVFLAGHNQLIKLSSKDEVLLPHLVDKMIAMNGELANYVGFAAMLKGCDAYIATGSNNSARYFEYYFSKYPNIIRKNRTSVAILTGAESRKELEALADDVHQFFGLGCRNVTKIYVPNEYDFVPLLEAFKKYLYLADHNKYKNNYDYQLAVMIINKQYYMTNGSILLSENKQVFSPISQLNFEYYKDEESVYANLLSSPDIQCVIGKRAIGFGLAQQPSLTDFADGVDTLQFLLSL